MFDSTVFAAGEGHGEGIPFQTIIYQSINIVIVIAGLIYFLKKTVKDFFSERRSSFLTASQKAEVARKQAEREFSEISMKLNKLNATRDESLAKARAESVDLRKQIISDAEAAVKKLQQDTEQSLMVELSKAKRQLREELIREAIIQARAVMNSKVSQEDHRRLEGNFIENMRVGN